MSNWKDIAFSPADILLPKNTDLTKWAVIACDQFTSEPLYWQEVERTVGAAPSTLRMILPEAKLEGEDTGAAITAIHAAMERYLAGGVFETCRDALIYVERTQPDGRVRSGLVGKIDLEAYDFHAGSRSLVRATEGTVLSRIPPRVRVRKGAPLEFPHVMMLIDDPDRTVIDPLKALGGAAAPLYDFDLMQSGGHLKGWLLPEGEKARVCEALTALNAPESQLRRYGSVSEQPLLYAVGDGNHSLASAKQTWEDLKPTLTKEEAAEHPARYALVELVNIHSDALDFEPIHRALFDVDPADVIAALKAYYPDAYEGEGEGDVFRWRYGDASGVITVPGSPESCPTGTIQVFIDRYLAEKGGKVDYIHGDETVWAMGEQPRTLALQLPPMSKETLFAAVNAGGALPRKTFSMGVARDKRYYMEGRRIL